MESIMSFNFKSFTKKHYVKLYIFHSCLTLGCIYGGYQLFSDRGLFTLYKLNETIKQQKQENELLAKRQKYLESRVQKLEDGEHFDYDYLDEIVREKLGVVKSTEKVIYVHRLES